MNVELFLYNIGYLITVVINVVLIITILVKKPKGQSASLFLTFLSFLSIYVISNLIAVNVTDPTLSRIAMFFTLATIITAAVCAHWVFTILKTAKEHVVGITISYVAVFLLVLFYIISPNSFLLLPVPKMYFPNYYVPGHFYWLFIALFCAIGCYFLRYLLKATLKATGVDRDRLRYILITFITGYIFGAVGFFLVYNISIDPLASVLFGFYGIFLGYAILKYELFDIKVLTKQALFYGSLTAAVTSTVTFISFSNNFLNILDPGFPIWVVPIITSVISVFIGVFVWEKIKEVDILKYEFINNVTHKFRAPLTHIRWLAEDLRDTTSAAEDRDKAIKEIQYATMRLFELTNILIDSAQTDSVEYLYRFTEGSVADMVREIYQSHLPEIRTKKQTVTLSIPEDLPNVKIDARRLSFAVQILFENALAYTPAGGTIIVSLRRDAKNVVYSIKDSGIGIPKEDLQFLFSKFYRAHNARLADTEGMGIGLFMSKNIIEKHGGRIWAESEGAGKGSTFYFTLPLI